MADGNIFKLDKPGQDDPLQEVLREGARKMLAAAIGSEVASFIDRHGSCQKRLFARTIDSNGTWRYWDQSTEGTGSFWHWHQI